jgi:predicted helicase
MNSRHKKAQQFLKQGLFDKINNFADLESRIEQLETKQMRGDAFEVFAQGYLATQKIVQAKSVWTFEDIPSRLMREIFIETPGDMGVDGVYKTVTDDRCAYQVKFRSRRANLQWSDLSTFMGLSEQADLRVLFTNSEKIPDLMDQRSKFYCIRGSDLDALKPNDFETIKTWLKAGRVKHKPHKPRPHQKAALREIKKVFKDADRAALVMACGTGKTLVALWAAEQSEANNILVLVPSLALVRQLLHEWLKHTTKWGNPSFMCVCSDPTVTRGDEVIVKQSELDFPVSTDSEDVSRYLKSRVEGPRIIFSTYQSAQVVADGMPDPFKFDLGFFDEAHKTAGRVGTKFAFALTDDNLKIKKLLFMTASL